MSFHFVNNVILWMNAEYVTVSKLSISLICPLLQGPDVSAAPHQLVWVADTQTCLHWRPCSCFVLARRWRVGASYSLRRCSLTGAHGSWVSVAVFISTGLCFWTLFAVNEVPLWLEGCCWKPMTKWLLHTSHCVFFPIYPESTDNVLSIFPYALN